MGCHCDRHAGTWPVTAAASECRPCRLCRAGDPASRSSGHWRRLDRRSFDGLAGRTGDRSQRARTGSRRHLAQRGLPPPGGPCGGRARARRRIEWRGQPVGNGRDDRTLVRRPGSRRTGRGREDDTRGFGKRRPRRLCAHLSALRPCGCCACRSSSRPCHAGVVHDRRRGQELLAGDVGGDGPSRAARPVRGPGRRAAYDGRRFTGKGHTADNRFS